MQNQTVGGRQQHLEKYEQVKQVAGQEGAVQAQEQKLDQYMEMHAYPVPACDRKHQRGQRKNARQDQHERRQAVHHKHDPKRCRPVAKQIDANAAAGIRCRCVGETQKGDRHTQ